MALPQWKGTDTLPTSQAPTSCSSAGGLCNRAIDSFNLNYYSNQLKLLIKVINPGAAIGGDQLLDSFEY